MICPMNQDIWLEEQQLRLMLSLRESHVTLQIKLISAVCLLAFFFWVTTQNL